MAEGAQLAVGRQRLQRLPLEHACSVEQSLRKAIELEPGRADAAVSELARTYRRLATALY